jgi:hypothetical protein
VPLKIDTSAKELKLEAEPGDTCGVSESMAM